MWKGGRSISGSGYVMLRMPEHPEALPNGYVFEHRIVMERTLGRRLSADERVHHKNEIKADNHPDNLELISPSAHSTLHNIARQRRPETGRKISEKLAEHYDRIGRLMMTCGWCHISYRTRDRRRKHCSVECWQAKRKARRQAETR